MKLPEGLPPPPAGYVYLGQGGQFKCSKCFRGAICPIPNQRVHWTFLHSMEGTSKHAHYAAPADSEIVKLNSMTLEDEIRYGKSLIGKKITNRNLIVSEYGVIKNVIVVTDPKELENIFDGQNDAPDQIEGIKALLGARPAVVLIKGVWQRGNTAVLCISFGEDHPSYPALYKENIWIGGHKLFESENIYTVNGRSIDKSLLREARNLLREVAGHSGYGSCPIASVKIGYIDFTLDMLNQLELD